MHKNDEYIPDDDDKPVTIPALEVAEENILVWTEDGELTGLDTDPRPPVAMVVGVFGGATDAVVDLGGAEVDVAGT